MSEGGLGGWRRALVCPTCRSPLEWTPSRLRCSRCAVEYEVVDGVPVLLPPQSLGDAHKAHQADYFDSVDREFEIERPAGTPRLYQWSLHEKFRRGTSCLRDVLAGGSALSACGGSGMDAELLSRAGARVLTADISVGASLRAAERAARRGVDVTPVVADVEALPIADQSVDVVYVHDGLHHLEDPLSGLAELARVARVAVSVNEPARAALTRLAIHVGAAYEEEEAGNRVNRLRPQSIAEELERRGFRVVRIERYGLYYRHVPGRVFALLSSRLGFAAARGGVAAVNALIGRFGNKFTVQAVRR